MKHLVLNPVHAVSGEINLPGSKSLTNRALLLSALATGRTRLDNPLSSEDTLRMSIALQQLGIDVSSTADDRHTHVNGNAGIFQTPENRNFFLGNAGTAIRPLTAILSLIPETFDIDGDQYMHERPIAHLCDALRQLGAAVEYLVKDGFPPVRLTGGNVKGGHVSIPGNISSQYLTALLIALPLVENDSTITVIGNQVSTPYLDITLGIMAQFGVTVTHEDYRQFRIAGRQQYRSPGHYLIEGDASSASYFFGAAAIAGEVTVHGIGKDSVQGDIRFLDTLEAMGAVVSRFEDHITVSSRDATMHTHEQHSLEGLDVDLNHIPDAAMTIAVLALFARGPTRIRNIYNWRVKETDRMHAMATELTKLGADVSTTRDSITIKPPAAIRSAVIDTYGDHRIAMCFSLAALGNAAITINDPDCTRKTFPDYFEVFSSICN